MRETILLIMVFLLGSVFIANASERNSEEYCITGSELFEYEFVEYTTENGCILMNSNGDEKNFFGDGINELPKV